MEHRINGCGRKGEAFDKQSSLIEMLNMVSNLIYYNHRPTLEILDPEIQQQVARITRELLEGV